MDQHDEERLNALQSQLLQLPDGWADRLHEATRRDTYAVDLIAAHATQWVNTAATCSRSYLLCVSGRSWSDPAGSRVLKLEELLCGIQTGEGYELVMVRRPQVVITVEGKVPAFATVDTQSTPGQGDGYILLGPTGSQGGTTYLSSVRSEVFTWNPDGTPAPNLRFSWICTVEAAAKFVIPG